MVAYLMTLMTHPGLGTTTISPREGVPSGIPPSGSLVRMSWASSLPVNDGPLMEPIVEGSRDSMPGPTDVLGVLPVPVEDILLNPRLSAAAMCVWMAASHSSASSIPAASISRSFCPLAMM